MLNLVRMVGLSLFLVVVGCSGERMEAEDVWAAEVVESPEAFTDSGEAEAARDWWVEFEDAGLTAAVERALAGNFTLATAWDRLAQARAIARQFASPLYPQVDLEARGSRTRQDIEGVDRIYTNQFVGGIAVAYEVDLWGRIRSQYEAAELAAAATEQEVQAAAISLAAAVATTWYQLAEANEQVRVLGEQIATNEQVLELITERFRQGQVTATDVLRQRQLVESTQGLRMLARQRAGVLAHQLAVLLGERPAEELGLGRPELTEVGPLPETGVPAEVLARRPDVRGRLLEILAQDRQVASAVAAQFPRVSIAGSIDTTAPRVRDLFDNWVSALAGNLLQPIFDADRLGSIEDEERAALSATLNLYGQTVLEALQDVEDALVLEEYQRAYLASLEEQLASADAVIERTREHYLMGMLDYLRVLDALTSRQSLERQYLTAQREYLEYRIGLYRALAGPIEIQNSKIKDQNYNSKVKDLS